MRSSDILKSSMDDRNNRSSTLLSRVHNSIRSLIVTIVGAIRQPFTVDLGTQASDCKVKVIDSAADKRHVTNHFLRAIAIALLAVESTRLSYAALCNAD